VRLLGFSFLKVFVVTEQSRDAGANADASKCADNE
jgi:hypothetical protein